ncbi:hypothetical protein [Chamaesiphon sp. OTE_75_metabat_556]|nr:hypothetical protein [Chamaesiphon sp. OTE_75_metabat_556]
MTKPQDSIFTSIIHKLGLHDLLKPIDQSLIGSDWPLFATLHSATSCYD